MKKHFPAWMTWLPSAALLVPLVAQASIYTCVDASGRRLTSDRPIAACLDRQQFQLSKSGVVKRVVPPSYTASEAAAIEASKRQAEAQRQQDKARAKSLAALLQRYPDASTHMAARMNEAESIQSRLREGYGRLAKVKTERAKLDEELAFYKKTPDNIPARLQTQVQANRDSEQAARQYIQSQRTELANLHKRYDTELALLKTLWK